MSHEDAKVESGAVDLIHLAADIAAAYVTNHSISPAELLTLLKAIHTSLCDMLAVSAAASVQSEEPVPVKHGAGLSPSVPIPQSVTPDHIVCLEDGLSFRSLKRHLGAAHLLTPQQYRARWSLPSDYPMVAENFAKARSATAKKIGLGRRKTK